MDSDDDGDEKDELSDDGLPQVDGSVDHHQHKLKEEEENEEHGDAVALDHIGYIRLSLLLLGKEKVLREKYEDSKNNVC